MTELIDRERAFSELPADVPIYEQSGADGGWTTAMFSKSDWRVEHVFEEDGNLVTEYYRLPPVMVKVLEMQRRHAREEATRDMRQLLGMGLWNMPELRVRLAKALHRRHHIDRVEFARMCARGLQGEGGANVFMTRKPERSELELSEAEVESSWAAEGTTRTYWVQLAGEALRVLQFLEPTEMPAPLEQKK